MPQFTQPCLKVYCLETTAETLGDTINVWMSISGGEHSHCTVRTGHLGPSQERHRKEWGLPHPLTWTHRPEEGLHTRWGSNLLCCQNSVKYWNLDLKESFPKVVNAKLFIWSMKQVVLTLGLVGVGSNFILYSYNATMSGGPTSGYVIHIYSRCC